MLMSTRPSVSLPQVSSIPTLILGTLPPRPTLTRTTVRNRRADQQDDTRFTLSTSTIFRNSPTSLLISRVLSRATTPLACSPAAFTTKDQVFFTLDSMSMLDSHHIACSTTSPAGSWAGIRPAARSSSAGLQKVWASATIFPEQVSGNLEVALLLTMRDPCFSLPEMDTLRSCRLFPLMDSLLLPLWNKQLFTCPLMTTEHSQWLTSSCHLRSKSSMAQTRIWERVLWKSCPVSSLAVISSEWVSSLESLERHTGSTSMTWVVIATVPTTRIELFRLFRMKTQSTRAPVYILLKAVTSTSMVRSSHIIPIAHGLTLLVIQYPTHVFKFSCLNGVPYFTKVADSPTNNAYILGVSHGTTTSLNGQPGTGLLWVSDVQNTNFKIYDAIPQNGYLNVIRNFTIVGITKFSRPVFGDGMAYIGTTVGYFYGLGSTNKSPLNCTASVDFGTASYQNTTSPQTINCTALFSLSVTNISLADATNYNITQTPSLPLSMSAGDTLQFSAQFSPQSVGRLGGTVNIQTSGVSDASYSKTTKVRLTGVGTSSNALLDISPKSVVFTGLVTGSVAYTQPILIGNDGTSNLTVSTVLYSNVASSGPFTTWTGTGNLTVGKFTLSGIPNSVSGGGDSAIVVTPDTSTSGNFTAWVKFVTTGGNATVSLSTATGDPPTALLEFQTPDGSGWVKYDPNTPFTFGNVTENASKSLLFRISNTAAPGGVKLGLTVSKPPFGVPGIVRSVNQVDLAEGTLIAPGKSQTATLTCNVPKSQWNVPSYNGTAQWTINTNDPTWSFEKRAVQFFCNAVAEQAGPLLPSGQGQYQYVGCFKENNPGRQLSNLLYANSSNTNGMCIETCAEEGLTFCGTQYQEECWAGNKIPNQKVDDANCNFNCAGSLSQYCGGNGVDGSGAYISLFADMLQWNGNLNDSSTSSAPQGPFVNPGVDGYTSIGCYTEATSGRALPNGRSVGSPTVAECVEACSNENFIYAGVEYGGEVSF